MSERQGGGSMVASRVIAVPAGQIATIVTCLEMTAPPAPVVPVKSALKLDRWTAPVDLARYRELFRAIGQPWLWRGRLVMDGETLAATLNAPTLEVHVATRRDGTPQGLLELDFSGDRECELAYFGLVPELTGRGCAKAAVAATPTPMAAPASRKSRFLMSMCAPSAFDFEGCSHGPESASKLRAVTSQMRSAKSPIRIQ